VKGRVFAPKEGVGTLQLYGHGSTDCHLHLEAAPERTNVLGHGEGDVVDIPEEPSALFVNGIRGQAPKLVASTMGLVEEAPRGWGALTPYLGASGHPALD
jgi:hypothetical protein